MTVSMEIRATPLRLVLTLCAVGAGCGSPPRIVPFSETLQIVGPPYLKPDPNDWKNPRNTQPNAMACMEQCEKLSKCRFGTYIKGGDRNKECWLSYNGGEDSTVDCGDPCESFTKVMPVGISGDDKSKGKLEFAQVEKHSGKKSGGGRESFAQVEAQLRKEESEVGRAEGKARFDSDTPTVFLLGPNPDFVQSGKKYHDPGASCHDPDDGDISHLIWKKEKQLNANTMEIDYHCKNNHNVYAMTKTRTVLTHVPPASHKEALIKIDAKLPKEQLRDFSQTELLGLTRAIAKVLHMPRSAVMVNGGSEFDDSIVLEIFIRVVGLKVLPQPQGFNAQVAATMGHLRSKSFPQQVKKLIASQNGGAGFGSVFANLQFSEAHYATDEGEGESANGTSGGGWADRQSFLMFGTLVAVAAAATVYISNRSTRVANELLGAAKRQRSRVDYSEITEPQDDELLLIG